MNVSETRKGELLVIVAGLLWSVFPILTVFTYRTVPSLVSLAWSTFFAALFFAGVVTYRKKWHELRDGALWMYSLRIALFIGVLFYGFYYTALLYTSPGNVALIGLCEVLTTYLLINVFHGEHFSREHTVGALLMVLGAGIVLIKDFSGLNIGDVLILASICCSPFGNMYQKRARAIASSESIMFLRSALSVPPLVVLAYIFGAHASFSDIRASLFLLVVSGVVLLGLSKFLWIEAIHRISLTKSSALNSFIPLFTLLFAWLLLNQVPDAWQLSSLVPLIIGALLLTDTLRFRSIMNA